MSNRSRVDSGGSLTLFPRSLAASPVLLLVPSHQLVSCPSTPSPSNPQTCEFIEEEESHLREELLAHPLGIYNEITATAGTHTAQHGRWRLVHGDWSILCACGLAATRRPTAWMPSPASPTPLPLCNLFVCAEAKGVVNNRLQNIVITMDKIKRVLQAPNQVGWAGAFSADEGGCMRVWASLWAGVNQHRLCARPSSWTWAFLRCAALLSFNCRCRAWPAVLFAAARAVPAAAGR